MCTAGITNQGKWIRLFPIDYRYRDFNQRYRKYEWIRLKICKSENDNRRDSYKPYPDTISRVKFIPPEKADERKKIILPTLIDSLGEIEHLYKTAKISLGIFRPKKIVKFIIEPDQEMWSTRKQRVLNQMVLFGKQTKTLEKIPYKFSYQFYCNGKNCKSHKLSIFDWEIFQLYRKLKERYPYDIVKVLEKVKEAWFDRMWSSGRETYLIVGTIFKKPSFVVVGVFKPK